MFLLFGLIMTVMTLGISGHPNGAPVTACVTMYPLHKHNAQTTPCPFESRPQQSEITSDSTLKITLHASSLTQPSLFGDSSESASSEENLMMMLAKPTGDSFKGYMIMAFDKNGSNSTAIGTFETPSGSHTIDCHGLQKNTATHSTNSLKKIVDLTWIPPAGFVGDVIFKATFVASKKLFWTEQFSVPVKVKSTPSKENKTPSQENENSELPLIEEIDFIKSTQYISLWAICSFFVMGFSCAIVAKLIFSSRSKKYVTVETI